jgi:DNA-binding response OmpR family regulator
LQGTLPTLDGFEVCRRIRLESTTPIILLTACVGEQDIVRGLHLGADGYVTKPFSPKQRLARMQAVLRRAGRAPAAHPPIRLSVC